MNVLLPLLTVTALTFILPCGVDAERLSLVQQRENAGALDTDQPAERRSEPDVPAIPPSRMDPGLQHMQEGREDLHASMSPRNLDPRMSTNPDVMPPGREGVLNPPVGPELEGSQGVQ